MNIMQMENGIMNITQKDKDLLLRYLSMSLPYGLKLKKYNEDNAVELYSINLEHETIQYWKYKSRSLQIGGYEHLIRFDKLQLKPYLRSLSSMTEEEMDAYANTGSFLYANGIPYNLVYTTKGLFFLLNNHFDIFGLIPKGLAIAVTEENNPYK